MSWPEHILSKWRNVPKGFICQPTVDGGLEVPPEKAYAIFKKKPEEDVCRVSWRRSPKYAVSSGSWSNGYALNEKAWGNGKKAVSWAGITLYKGGKEIEVSSLPGGSIIGAAVAEVEGNDVIRIVHTIDGKTLNFFNLKGKTLTPIKSLLLPNDGHVLGAVRFSGDGGKCVLLNQHQVKVGERVDLGPPATSVDVFIAASSVIEVDMSSTGYIEIFSAEVSSTTEDVPPDEDLKRKIVTSKNAIAADYSLNAIKIAFSRHRYSLVSFVFFLIEIDIKTGIIDFNGNYISILDYHREHYWPGGIFNERYISINGVRKDHFADPGDFSIEPLASGFRKTKRLLFITPENDIGLIDGDTIEVLISGETRKFPRGEDGTLIGVLLPPALDELLEPSVFEFMYGTIGPPGIARTTNGDRFFSLWLEPEPGGEKKTLNIFAPHGCDPVQIVNLEKDIEMTGNNPRFVKVSLI